jgi:hypothetical protein
MAYISPAKLLSTIRRHRFGLGAFLIPLGVRAIPEILVGPYPIGWDTIAFYVPNTPELAIRTNSISASPRRFGKFASEAFPEQNSG